MVGVDAGDRRSKAMEDWIQETQWLLWVGAAILAGLLETLSLDFVFTMLVGGALAAAATAFLGGSFTLQVIVFAIVSGVLLVVARPPMKRWATHRAPFTPTNAHALVGRQAETLTEVTTHGGQVKLAGEVWTARAAPGSRPLEPHSIAHVVAIDGATAVVENRPATAGDITPEGEPA
jgi:membrane protein implicated in regulation of membrane protease activity